MAIFLILAPFGSFALLMLVTSAEISLFAAAAICLAVVGIDRLSRPLDQDARRGLRRRVHRTGRLRRAGRSDS